MKTWENEHELIKILQEEMPKPELDMKTKNTMYQELLSKEKKISKHQTQLKWINRLAYVFVFVLMFSLFALINEEFVLKIASPSEHNPKQDNQQVRMDPIPDYVLDAVSDKNELAKVFKDSRDIIDRALKEGKEGYPTGGNDIYQQMEKLRSLFPPLLEAYPYIMNQGDLKAKGKNYRPFDEEEYQKLKEMKWLPWVENLTGDEYSNAFMHLDRGTLDNPIVKQIRDKFDGFYNYLRHNYGTT